jgi:hypothetical protein
MLPPNKSPAKPPPSRHAGDSFGDGSAQTIFSKKMRTAAPTKGIVGAMLVCATVAVSIGIWKLVEHEDARSQEARLVVRNLGEKYAQDIGRQLKSSVSATYALAAFAQIDEHGVLDESFDKIARTLITGYSGITNLQFAPGGVVRHISPFTPADQAALGHNLLVDPARRNLTVTTILGRRIRIDGPRAFLQGGWGLLARYPIFTAFAPEFVSNAPFKLGNKTYTIACDTREEQMANCYFPGPNEGENKTYFFAFVRASPRARAARFAPADGSLHSVRLEVRPNRAPV